MTIKSLENEEKIIEEFLRSIGPWKDFIVVGGGFALMIYKLYFSDPTTERIPIGTRDIDSLVPRKIPEVSKKNIAKFLIEAGFTHVFKDLNEPPTEGYIKKVNNLEIEIEFLTDALARKNKYKNVFISGIVAQPLSYLELSLEVTREFQTSSGELGWVVSPGAWIFHKGLTFLKRRNLPKICKDLYGIWYVSSQLGEFSIEAVSELKILKKERPNWGKTFINNLKNWLRDASPSDYSILEAQDPFGKLKRGHFNRIISEITGV
ncbi:MAG: hypothetical protein SNF33_03275 [Candidatus Algichlamydia australiensis]|nr:hypothetical protein [Chlamydiales bacterium]